MARNIALTEELTPAKHISELFGGKYTLSRELKREILDIFWGITLEDELYDTSRFDTFFRLFETECRSAAKLFRAHNFPLKTFADLLQSVEYVKSHSNKTKKEHLLFFSRGFETAMGLCALEIVVHFWLLINVEVSHPTTHPLTYKFSQRSKIPWVEDQSLESLLAAQFPKASSSLARKLRRPYIFNAYNLDRIGGFKILWTDDLQDHLVLNEDDKSLLVFHHVFVLQALAEGDCSEMIKELARETIQSLALLFPMADKSCQKWLEKKSVSNVRNSDSFDHGLTNLPREMETRLPKFYKHWGERLTLIMEVFDETEPTTLSQWWYDQRRGVQRWTFWIAAGALALTVIFGFLQTLIGA